MKTTELYVWTYEPNRKDSNWYTLVAKQVWDHDFFEGALEHLPKAAKKVHFADDGNVKYISLHHKINQHLIYEYELKTRS